MAEHYSKEGRIQEIANELFEKNENWEFDEETGRTFKTLYQRASYEYTKKNRIPEFSSEESKAQAREDAKYYYTFSGIAGWAMNANVDVVRTAVEYGENPERSIRQIRAYLRAFDGVQLSDDDRRVVNKLRDAIGTLKSVETLSPYYELKNKQILIERYQKQKLKEPNKAAEYQKKIDGLQKDIYDFLDNCENEGLDREIAEEYLKDARANLNQEELEASRVKIDSNLGKNTQPAASQKQQTQPTQPTSSQPTQPSQPSAPQQPRQTMPQQTAPQQPRQTSPQQTQPSAPQQTMPQHTQPTQPTQTQPIQPQQASQESENDNQSGGFKGYYRSERKEAAAAMQNPVEPKTEKVDLQEIRFEQLMDIDNHRDLHITHQDLEMIAEKSDEAYRLGNSQQAKQYQKLCEKLIEMKRTQDEQLQQNRQVQQHVQNAMQETEDLSRGRGR